MRSRPGFVVPHLSASFSPTDIAGCVLWLDASDAASITESSGAVSQWDDLSGNGNHVTQGTGANQPATGTQTIGGLNVLEFAGATDSMKVDTGASLAAWTMFFVVKVDGGLGSASILFRPHNGAGDPQIYRESLNSLWYGGVSTTGQAWSDSDPHQISWWSSAGTGMDGRFDGTDLAGTGHQAFDNPIWIHYAIGGYTTDTWYAEIVLYDSVLDSTDTATVEDYLNTKWGL